MMHKSSKQVFHFAFDVNDVEMAYDAGDALGIIPLNSDSYVTAVLQALSIDASTMVGNASIFDILKSQYEIRIPSKDLVQYVADKSSDKALAELLNDKPAMTEFMHGRETLDFIKDYGVTFDAGTFSHVCV